MTSLPKWTQAVHHDGSEVYLSNPLPQLGETITVRLRTPQSVTLRAVYMRAMLDGEFKYIEMALEQETSVAQFWSCELTAQQPHITYLFVLAADDGGYFYYAKGIGRADVPETQMFTLLAGYDAPLWVRDQVFYQIFPERFHNGDPTNDVQDGQYTRRGYKSVKRAWDEMPLPFKEVGSMDFFGGDLQGITQKLDYLVDLGVTALYLTPIFKAESNHKYDIVDFFSIDPHFGGEDALVALREATRERDIRLMLDITPNHCSFHHPWYLAAKESHDPEYADHFYYDEKSGGYEMWLGVASLIKLNYHSQKLRDRMYRQPDSAIQKWLKPPYDVDAWRLDVANMTGNRAEMQLDHDVWRELRQAVRTAKPDAYLLGEYFQDGTPHLQGDELDASMNYQGFNMPLRRWLGGDRIIYTDKQPWPKPPRITTEAMIEQWQTFLAEIAYPVALQQFNQLDSHDTTRILHVTGEDKALAQLGTALMMAFPGVPCIYYGGEIGMTGANDPDNRRPMLWDESAWDDEMRAYFQRLIALRKESPALKHGGYQMLHAAEDWLAFMRQSKDETILVVGYRGTEPLTGARFDVAQAGLEDGTQVRDLLSVAELTVNDGMLALPALEHGQAMLLRVVSSA